MIKIDRSITIRSGRQSDSYDIFLLFEETYAELLNRMGSSTPTSISDPEKLAEMWQQRKPMYEHLAKTADQFWVAEENGEVIGYSRSLLRGDLRQLTELFVKPDKQSGGLGSELFRLAFPNDDVQYKSTIATADMRAQALYLKSGVRPRFLAYYFGKRPQPRVLSSELNIIPMETVSNCSDLVGKVDKLVLGMRRDVDHNWLRINREGYLYFRGDEVVGYGYLGKSSGPFAMLDPELFPIVLDHAENTAAEAGRDHFGIEVPMVNQNVLEHLINRDYKADNFTMLMMTNWPFGNFDKYILFSPSFFI